MLDVGGGLRIVATPGHTPGTSACSTSRRGTLIIGDALFQRRRLRLCPRPICSDFRLNERSAQLLGELEYERVGFAHGTEITQRRPGGRARVSARRRAPDA